MATTARPCPGRPRSQRERPTPPAAEGPSPSRSGQPPTERVRELRASADYLQDTLKYDTYTRLNVDERHGYRLAMQRLRKHADRIEDVAAFAASAATGAAL